MITFYSETLLVFSGKIPREQGDRGIQELGSDAGS